MKAFNILIFLHFVFSFPVSGQVDDHWREKIDVVLIEQLEKVGQVEFLVVLKDQLSIVLSRKNLSKLSKGEIVFNALSKHARQSQKDILHTLIRKGVDYQSLFIVNLLKIKGNGSLIKELAMRPDVKYIINNPYIQMDGPIEDRQVRDLRSVEWGISAIGADLVWKMGYRGRGVVIGGQDTGYEWDHPAIKTKYRGYIDSINVDHNYNWHDAIYEINPMHGDTIVSDSVNPCGLQSEFPCDDHNHGTHTMGTMVGGGDTLQVGVAPEAKWIGCRNMERGYGTPYTYLESFQWFLAPTDLNNQNPDPSKAPHVINNSWSCPPKEGCSVGTYEVMRTAVNNLRRAGIVVVVSAGNSGPGCNTVNTPAPIYEESFSVGAIARNDTIAKFSSRGNVLTDSSGRIKPNVVAPGVKVISSIRNGKYKAFSGTSMAGPHVAGTVALMISANPEIAGYVEVIENILEATAIPHFTDQECGGIVGSEVPNNTYGYGAIDAMAAVEAAIITSVDEKFEEEKDKVKVYPNPVSDYLYFRTEDITGNFTLSISDISGRQLLSQQWEALPYVIQSVDLTPLHSGIYIFSISNEDQSWSGKLIKQ